MKFSIISENPDTQKMYETMRINGEGHNVAEMLALRQFPSVNTDDTFNRGKGEHMLNELQPIVRERYLSEAKKAGISIAGKHYYSGLARFPGDPKAWITTGSGARGDVERLCKKRGWGCRGSVNVKRAPTRERAC